MGQGFFGFMLPQVSWTPPDISRLPSWRDAKVVSIDVECRDEDLEELGPGVRRDPSKNYVCGVAFAIEDHPDGAHYLPIRHEGGDNLPLEHVRQYLRDQFAHFRGVITGCALEYDLDWLWNGELKIEMPHVAAYQDVQVRDVLINELQDRYSLNALCERWGLPPKDEAGLNQTANAFRVHPKKGLHKLPGRYVRDYAVGDVKRPLAIRRRQMEVIARDGLDQGPRAGGVVKLEDDFLPICVRMRHRGIRIGMDRVESIERDAVAIETEELRKIKHATGVEIAVGDVWKKDAIARALERFGVTAPSTTKVGRRGKTRVEYEIDNVFLKRKCGEVGEWLVRAREWNRLRTTYCQQMRDYAVWHGDEWRIHPTTNQVKSTDEDDGSGDGKASGKGVRYGRTSCSDPSVQNQPVRNKMFGKRWRSVFLPDRGARWGCSDWAQQEPRICVHYAEAINKMDPRLCRGAREFADEYRRNPKLDIHSKLTELSGRPPSERTIIKNYVNGRLYGMGDAKLCIHLDLPIVGTGRYRDLPDGSRIEIMRAGPEGQRIIDEFRRFAPWIDDFTRHASDTAKKRGCVWTILRRRCNFPRRPDGSIDYSHKAGNRVGQGGAADQMKATAIEVEREGIPIQMIIHDEFDFSFTDVGRARRVKELQENTVRFSVPMRVDLEVGNESDGGSWGELDADAA